MQHSHSLTLFNLSNLDRLLSNYQVQKTQILQYIKNQGIIGEKITKHDWFDSSIQTYTDWKNKDITYPLTTEHLTAINAIISPLRDKHIASIIFKRRVHLVQKTENITDIAYDQVWSYVLENTEYKNFLINIIVIILGLKLNIL